MSDKTNSIYALIHSKKPKNKESQSVSFGGFTAVVDGYIEGETVTPDLLKKLHSDDTLVVENIQALGTSLNEIIKTLNEVAEYGVNLCLISENLSFEANKLPEIADSLLLAWKLHQSLISLRSKTALQERKEQGVKLGRPYSSNPSLKLDDYKDEIKQLLLTGMSKDDIAEQYNVCRSTVYNFVKKNPELLVGNM